MPESHQLTMLLWVARDILRRPGRSVLLFTCLASLVFLMATPLLLSRALENTWTRLVDKAPDLVVRRIDAGGWAPLPADEAIACARTVPGVLDPTARLWGVATGPDGPVTVVASTTFLPQDTLEKMTPPPAGHAIIGQWVAGAASGKQLTLIARNQIQVEIAGTFPEGTDLVTSDVVFVTHEDARQLLGLTPQQSSDLTVRLFRREEESAIQADLAAAFPWPVSITDRSTSLLRHRTLAARTGGVGILLAIPALLAMLLLIADIVMGNRRRQSFWGLLQAMGWTTKDLVRVEVAKASIIGAPAIATGMALAHLAVFCPTVAGITASLAAGWRRLPVLTLDGTGALLVMVEVAALVGLPYLSAVFLTSLRSTAGESWNAIQADSWN